MSRAVLVVNASKTDPDGVETLRAAVTAAFADAGWPEPAILLTTEKDPGTGQARAAIRDGAEFVVACGGDGTVNAVAEALAGTGVSMGIIPMGTGNLLAMNLGISAKADDAIAVLTDGIDRTIDVGKVVGAETNRVFVGMAGLGLDAAMVADAPAGLKKKVGWPAYLVSIARHLMDRGVTVELELDGHRVSAHHVRTLIVGNIGRLQGGLSLLPDAEPDDGVLDVVVLAPRGSLVGWLAVAARLLTQRDRKTAMVMRYRARHIVCRTHHPIAQELDGEPFRTGTTLDLRVQPEALTVRVPR